MSFLYIFAFLIKDEDPEVTSEVGEQVGIESHDAEGDVEVTRVHSVSGGLVDHVFHPERPVQLVLPLRHRDKLAQEQKPYEHSRNYSEEGAQQGFARVLPVEREAYRHSIGVAGTDVVHSRV